MHLGLSQAVELDSVRLNAPTLNDVVITSSKNDHKTIEIPASVTLISPTNLTNWNITGVKDISAVVPNLFFPDYGSKLTSPVYIRGIGSKINAPSVGLYVDGIPFFEKSVFDFEFNDVERIEVLRGPQGTLYGRNTMGGIIQMFTRNPFRNPGGKFSLSGGNYGKREVSASYYGKMTPSLAYSVSGKYNHQGGYFINQHTGKTADKLDAASGAGKLIWKFNDHTNLGMLLQYDYLDQNGYPYAKMDSTGSIGAVNYDSVSSYKRKVFTGSYFFNKEYRFMRLKSTFGFQSLNDHQAIDQDFTPLPTTFAKQDQNQFLMTKELVLQSVRKSRYEWLWGYFFFSQKSSSNVNVKTSATTLKDYDAPTWGWATYHQSTYNNLIVKGLTLTAGIRYDFEKGSQDYLYRQQISGSMLTKADLNTTLRFTQWSPKVSLQYRANSDNMLYASVAKGYKTGGFNTSFDTNDEQTFKPEYSWNYEFGHKYGFLENRLSGEWAVFYTDWKSQQISQPVQNGGTMLRNAGQSYTMGVEFALQAVLCSNWNAQISYGLTEAKFENYTSGINDYSGKNIPYIPHHTFSVSSDYTWNIRCKSLDKVLFSGQFTETGKLYWNDQNSAFQDRYGILNGKISLVRKNLMLDFWVKNALDTKYTAFYFKMSNSSPISFGQKGKPRTIGATFTVLLH